MSRSTTATTPERLSTLVAFNPAASRIGINEFDMIEVKILKNGGKAIPGNGERALCFLRVVTAFDIYSALGERLKKMRMDEASSRCFPSSL